MIPALRHFHLLFLCTLLSTPTLSQTTRRVTVDSTGVAANDNSGYNAISADGRYVAFHSFATNLVPGVLIPNNVYVHDRVTLVTEAVTTNLSGTPQGDGSTSPVAISADGRYVAFVAADSTLVPNDTNGLRDVFVRDRQTGATELVSVSSTGVQSNSGVDSPTISADGRFVAFAGAATNLGPAGLTGSFWRIWLRDRLLGTTELVSISSIGAFPNALSVLPSISADGRFVAFESVASNLSPGGTSGFRDVFVRDRLAGTTDLVSRTPSGNAGNLGSFTAKISADGRFVAFTSSATNLVPTPDVNGLPDVYVRDLQTATTRRASLSMTGAEADGISLVSDITADGRLVLFTSGADNLVAGDVNGWNDAFVRDMVAGTTELVSLSSSGSQGTVLDASAGSISADGRFVLFRSQGPDYVGGDTDLVDDIFLRDRGPSPVITFCSGDGSASACPCGNTGSLGFGCANSLDSNGASLDWAGTSSLQSDSLVLRARRMPDSAALYFQGTAAVAGGAGVAFGDGIRCAGGSIVRLGVQTNVGGASQYPAAGDLPVSVRGMISAPGVRTYQVWYRNAASFCTPDTFNLTNAVQVVWN